MQAEFILISSFAAFVFLSL